MIVGRNLNANLTRVKSAKNIISPVLNLPTTGLNIKQIKENDIPRPSGCITSRNPLILCD